MAVAVQPVDATSAEYYDIYYFYTPTYIIACVAAGFLLISIIIERFLHHLGKWLHKRHKKPLLVVLERIKDELMQLGLASILIAAFSSQISSICVTPPYGNQFVVCPSTVEKFVVGVPEGEAPGPSEGTPEAAGPLGLGGAAGEGGGVGVGAPAAAPLAAAAAAEVIRAGARRLLQALPAVASSAARALAGGAMGVGGDVLGQGYAGGVPGSHWGLDQGGNHLAHSGYGYGSGGGAGPNLAMARRELAEGVAAKCPKGMVPAMPQETLHHVHSFIFCLALVHILSSCLTMLIAQYKLRLWKAWKWEQTGQELAGSLGRGDKDMQFICRHLRPVKGLIAGAEAFDEHSGSHGTRWYAPIFGARSVPNSGAKPVPSSGAKSVPSSGGTGPVPDSGASADASADPSPSRGWAFPKAALGLFHRRTDMNPDNQQAHSGSAAASSATSGINTTSNNNNISSDSNGDSAGAAAAPAIAISHAAAIAAMSPGGVMPVGKSRCVAAGGDKDGAGWARGGGRGEGEGGSGGVGRGGSGKGSWHGEGASAPMLALMELPSTIVLTLSHGFSPTKNFHGYLVRSMEHDFIHVVGVSWYLWLLACVLLIFNFRLYNIDFYISLIPFVLTLMIGTKLEYVMAQLALEEYNRTANIGSSMKGRDSLFWFNNPKLLLHFLHYILFQNAYMISYTFWTLWQFYTLFPCEGTDWSVIARTAVSVVTQLICSFVTLPLYALVAHMGSGPRVEAALSETVVARLLSWRGRHEKDELDRAKEVFDGVKGKVKTASGEVAAGLKKAEEAIAKPLHSIMEGSTRSTRSGSSHGGSAHSGIGIPHASSNGSAGAGASARPAEALAGQEIAEDGKGGDLDDLERIADNEAALENGEAAYHYPYGDV